MSWDIAGFINKYKDSPKHAYKWLMDFIGYIVGTTSDQAADIAARSLPIVAPLPNAISVYFVSQSALGFNEYQAIAFACAIEIAMFAVIEIALIMFDGLLKDERRYRGAFKLSLGVSVGVLILIILFVVFVEVSHEGGNPVLAGMPLLSGASAIMLALKRWHLRNENEEKNVHEGIVAELSARIEKLTNEVKDGASKISIYIAEIAALKTDVSNKDSQLIRQSERVETLGRDVARLTDLTKTLDAELMKKTTEINDIKSESISNDTFAKAQIEQIERLKRIVQEERDARSTDAAKHTVEIDGFRMSNADLQREIERNKSEIMELRVALARSEEQAKAAQKAANTVRPNSKPEPKPNAKVNKHEAFKIIIDHCENNPFATLSELQEVTGKGKSTVSEYLTEMERDKVIHRNGNGIEILRRL